jgi:O-antigen/teichoic acid export membrane protein
MIRRLKNKVSRKFKDDDFSEIVKKSASGFLISTVGRLLGFVEQWIMTNLYGAALLGVYRLCFSYLNLIGIFGRFGIDAATTRFVAQFRKQGEDGKVLDVFRLGYRIVTRLAVGLCILLIIAAPFLSRFIYHDPALTVEFQIIAVGIIFFVLSGVIEEGIRGLKKIKQFTWINNVSTQGLMIVLLLLGLLLKDKSYVINISYVISLGFTFILGITYWKKFAPKAVQKVNSITRKELLQVSIPLLSAKYLTVLYTMIATPIMAAFVSIEDVGIFNAAARLTAFATMPLIAVNNITGPKFAESFLDADQKKLRNNVYTSTRLIFWSCMPIMFLFFLMPKLLLSIWGPEFISDEAILTFHIINIGQAVNFATGPVTQLLNMTGRQKITQGYAIVTTVVSIALCFILIPDWGLGLGMVGAAIATSTGRTILNLGCALHIYITMGINTIYNPFRDLARIAGTRRQSGSDN